MDVYQGFFTLKAGVKDLDFVEALSKMLDHLVAENKIVSWRLLRRKLGLGPKELGDFHMMIETEGLAQLDEAFSNVASRAGDIETLHYDVNSKIESVTFALYRDFPDSVRKSGEERF